MREGHNGIGGPNGWPAGCAHRRPPSGPASGATKINGDAAFEWPAPVGWAGEAQRRILNRPVGSAWSGSAAAGGGGGGSGDLLAVARAHIGGSHASEWGGGLINWLTGRKLELLLSLLAHLAASLRAGGRPAEPTWRRGDAQ